MADLTRRNESFITTVLSINGRVRPVDLHSVAEQDRAAVIRAYLDAHAGEMMLHMQGEDLVLGGAPVVQAPFPVPPAPVPRVADLSEASAPSPTEDLGAAQPVPAFEPASPNVAEPTPHEFDILAPQEVPQEAQLEAFGAALTVERVSIVWWLLAIVLPVVGGLAAWLAVKGKDARQALGMLITSVVVGVVAAGLLYVFAGPLLFGMTEQPSVRPVPRPSKAATATLGATATPPAAPATTTP